MLSCPSCNRQAPADSRYCPGCGRALPSEGEALYASTVVAGSSVLTTGTPESVSRSAIDHGRFSPGDVIANRYRIVGLLGKGGMGEIYRADDLKLGQSVALKFLPEVLAGDENRLARFHAEVRVARQVSHPNVCRVYDIGEFEGHTYLSMEYIDGEDLASLVRRIGRLPRDKAIDIARQMCAGLAAVHERGILHRDLKPMNVMLDGRGHARITDFGLAALAEELVGGDARAGTPAYMAPELLTGGGASPKSDVYSLGLVFYEIFTGKRAFEGKTLADLTRLHCEQPPTNPSSLIEDFDPAVERVILKCLAKDPADRPPTALAVAAALPGGDPLAAALAAGETPPPELVAAARSAPGARPAAALGGLVSMLLAVLLMPLINGQTWLHAYVSMDKRPEVLADRAQQLLAKLGYGQPAGDHAYGFAVNAQVLRDIEARDQSSARWAALGSAQPAAMEFWYRQSPQHLVALNVEGVVTYDDPPPLTPGMVNLRLSPDGRLVGLRVVPPRTLEPPASPVAADWSLLFAEAGLRMFDFTPVEPRRVPPVYSDERAAWTGRYTENPETAIRVEAAALRGKPVYLEIAPDGGFGASTEAGNRQWAAWVAQVISVALIFAALVGAALLAHRNLRLGRGDRRGATRLSLFVLTAIMLSLLLGANHVPGATEELRLFAVVAGQAAFGGGLCWLLYIALEPLVRRRWPDMMIPWTRLLSGRFRDPLVGRDLLVGGLFGLAGVMLQTVRYFGATWFGGPPPAPARAADITFLGVRYDLVQLLQIVISALLQPLFSVVILLILLSLLRRRWLAVAAFFVILGGTLVLASVQRGGNLWADAGYWALFVAGLLFVLLRFGLLALVFALFYMLLLSTYPLTYDVSAWYFDSSLFALGIAAALAVYGYYVTMAGRPLLNPEPAMK